MTRSLDEKDGLDRADLKLLADVKEHGWHIVRVFRSADETGPEWAFSVGIFHTLLHPEIILFGLDLHTCARIINEIGAQVRAGKRFDRDGEFGDIFAEPVKCAFRPVAPKYFGDYVGFAQWFYQADPFPLLQCFWPDKEGRYTWSRECDKSVRGAQPLLFRG